MDLEKDLNKSQLEAVLHRDGPLMVVAGAGSGKTRVITYRIANLIKNYNVKPYNILGVTFTNKAADEMRERIFKLLNKSINEMLIKTFHSTCVWILRRESIYIGIPHNFNIIDEIDQRNIIKKIIEKMNLEFDNEIIKLKIEKISKWKNTFLGSEIPFESIDDELTYEIYRNYENYKKNTNSLDFDDLILKVVELFKTEKKILEKYQDIFQYILVDEFQDTNEVQYEFIKLLSIKHRNICVVGDEDQSIYSWRGAKIENIFKFKNDFKDAKIVLLEQNYRSTQNILDFATDIINKNYRIIKKNLYSVKKSGEPVKILQFYDNNQEAQFIAYEILNLTRYYNYSYKDIAVFFRVNYLSRSIENFLKTFNIPYIFIGGVKFFERKEIKDIIAYLKLIENKYDEVSLLRIINIPHRKIGENTLKKIETYATENSITLYDALLEVDKIPQLKTSTKDNIKKFLNEIELLIEKKDKISLTELVNEVINSFEYSEYLSSNFPEDYDLRIGNISELVNHIREIENQKGRLTLSEYLEIISLRSDIDDWDESADSVSLMTLHNAKGLEFKVVFILGLQDKILPHIKSLNDDPYYIEEERRLLYVGVTRAKERLYLTFPEVRNFFGKPVNDAPSRFLLEIDKNLYKFYDMRNKYSYY